MKRKAGIFARPTLQVVYNDKMFPGMMKAPIFDTRPNANQLMNVYRFADLYLEAPLPMDAIRSAGGLMGIGTPAKDDTSVLAGKILGPLAGMTISKGYPGGPARGASVRRQEETRKNKLFGR